ncbi:MAG: hypothetical protein SFW09_09190, partial [Hyphomicrobiaceae bacterium]|nr:hypothetical protein [Hyphomicrobiaceae bacterium]
AALRIRNEVALMAPDVVFWQAGAADAIARTPPDELKDTLNQAIGWLKEHEIDVVLIGMRYIRAMARDKHYQDIRRAIRDAQREQGILRVGHYEAVETLDRIRRQRGESPTELDLTDAGALCMANFLSRALAAKLFAKPQPTALPAPSPTGSDTGSTPAPSAPDQRAPAPKGN